MHEAKRGIMSKFEMSRRTALKAGFAAAAITSLTGTMQGEKMTERKKRIKQSVCRWCYQKIPLDELCASAAQMGLMGVDLLQPEEYRSSKAPWACLHHGVCERRDHS